MRTKSVILILVFIGLTLYSNTHFNGFVGDDFPQILNNTNVHSITNIPKFFTSSTYENGGSNFVYGIFYRPLMLSFYSLFYSISGQDPFIYHLFQIVLHVANSILIFFFIRSFLKNTPAFFVALLFLIHPINNEAVVYNANLQETLCFFFGMSAILIIKNTANTLKSYFFISILLLLSLFSKESAVLFIALSIIYSWLFKRDKLKLLIIANSVALIIYTIFRYPIARMYEAQESIAPISQASLLERLIQIPAIITYYLKLFIFPIQISIDHFWFITKLTWSNFYFPFIISFSTILLIFIGCIFFYQKYHKSFKTYLFFSLWFLIGLFLHLQIIKLDATVADRWFYFPIVGLLGIITLSVQQIKIRSKLIQKISFAILVIIIILFSIRTFQRNFDWRDDLTLMSHDINITPKNFILDNLYASALIADGQFKKAKPYVESSINAHPFYANLNNMAIIYVEEGKYKNAKKYLKEAVNSSRFYIVYENYANFLLVYDDLKEAEEFTTHSLKLFPKNSKLWMILAKIQYFRGDKKSALVSAQKAFKILPNENNNQLLSYIKSSKLYNPRIINGQKPETTK